MSNTRVKTRVEWHEINWRKLERRVYKLQKRIYQASSRADYKAVRKLQKTLKCQQELENSLRHKRVNAPTANYTSERET